MDVQNFLRCRRIKNSPLYISYLLVLVIMWSHDLVMSQLFHTQFTHQINMKKHHAQLYSHVLLKLQSSYGMHYYTCAAHHLCCSSCCCGWHSCCSNFYYICSYQHIIDGNITCVITSTYSLQHYLYKRILNLIERGLFYRCCAVGNFYHHSK